MAKQRWWKKALIVFDRFLLVFVLAMDILFRLFENYLVGIFSFLNADRRLVVICTLVTLFCIKQVVQSLLIKKGESKMIKFLKKLFRREFRKYKLLLKDSNARKVVSDALDKLIEERKRLQQLTEFVKKAKEQLKDRHDRECEELAMHLVQNGGQ